MGTIHTSQNYYSKLPASSLVYSGFLFPRLFLQQQRLKCKIWFSARQNCALAACAGAHRAFHGLLESHGPPSRDFPALSTSPDSASHTDVSLLQDHSKALLPAWKPWTSLPSFSLWKSVISFSVCCCSQVGAGLPLCSAPWPALHCSTRPPCLVSAGSNQQMRIPQQLIMLY